MYGILVKPLAKTMNKPLVALNVSERNYKMISLMLRNGVFDIRNGSVALHFNHLGDLTSIHRADVLYDSRFKIKLSTEELDNV